MEQGLKLKNWKTSSFSLLHVKYALMISNSPGDYFFKLCKLKKITTILRVDGFYLPTIFDNKQYDYRSKRILDNRKVLINQRLQKDLFKSDWVIYQSNYNKRNADKYLYNRIHNFTIIPNGVDTNHFIPLEKPNRNKYTLMMLGTWRDADLFLCSLNAFLYAWTDLKCTLKIIGGMTKEIEKVYSDWLQHNKGIQKSVKTTGQVSAKQLPKLISKCDISIHIKSGDSCPNAVLEAMSCGVPVICHSHGGTKELVGNTGIIIEHPKFYYDDLLSKKTADAIHKILKKRREYSIKARNRVLSSFDIDLMTNKYLDVLKHI